MEGSCSHVPGIPGGHILARLYSCVKTPQYWGVMSLLFGEKLRLLRRQHNMTQVELADRLSLASYTHITKIEASQRAASLRLVLAMAEVFGVTTDYLLRDTIAVHDIVRRSVGGERSSNTAMAQFGAKLRSLRELHRMSQVELAQRLSLARQAYISNLEAGRKEPSPELVLRIADLFGVTSEYLLSDALPC